MITVDDVKSATGLDPADEADAQWLADVVASVNYRVSRLPVVVDTDDPLTWTPEVRWGAIGLAVHRYGIRGALAREAYPASEVDRALGLRRLGKPSVSGVQP